MKFLSLSHLYMKIKYTHNFKNYTENDFKNNLKNNLKKKHKQNPLNNLKKITNKKIRHKSYNTTPLWDFISENQKLKLIPYVI